jgi:inhibitor of KinA
MIYERPVHRPLGDLAMAVEVSDELHVEHSFRILALDLSLKDDPLAGVTETIPTHRTLGIVFDPFVTSYRRLSDALREREPDVIGLSELPSRLVEIPIWYDDPWSRECARQHGVPPNMDYLAEINHMTVQGVIDWHTGREHWVSAVGFQPSTYQAIPLDATEVISAPKYERPRKTTPAGIVCFAGQITSYYPFESPGGYQLLGRTPLELYDPSQRLPDFKDGPVLPKVGDRHRYVSIGEEEYHELRARVEEGNHPYRIEQSVCRLADYREAA